MAPAWRGRLTLRVPAAVSTISGPKLALSPTEIETGRQSRVCPAPDPTGALRLVVAKPGRSALPPGPPRWCCAGSRPERVMAVSGRFMAVCGVNEDLDDCQL